MVTEFEIIKEYTDLLNSGHLFELFPYLSGSWDEDKDMFVELFLYENINH